MPSKTLSSVSCWRTDRWTDNLPNTLPPPRSMFHFPNQKNNNWGPDSFWKHSQGRERGGGGTLPPTRCFSHLAVTDCGKKKKWRRKKKRKNFQYEFRAPPLEPLRRKGWIHSRGAWDRLKPVKIDCPQSLCLQKQGHAGFQATWLRHPLNIFRKIRQAKPKATKNCIFVGICGEKCSSGSCFCSFGNKEQNHSSGELLKFIELAVRTSRGNIENHLSLDTNSLAHAHTCARSLAPTHSNKNTGGSQALPALV